MPHPRLTLTLSRTTAAAAILFVAACNQQPDAVQPAFTPRTDPHPELQWARAALERNPEIKVISVDADRGSIRIQIKSSAETVNVSPGELAAIPIADLVELTTAAREVTAPNRPVTEESIPPPPPAQVESPPERVVDYKVEREDGRTRITGPGMSVESTTATSAVEQPSQQKFNDPIICEGSRMLHLDRRRINVDGDAVVARGGCELHITNSRITATGTGIKVQDAQVHISNSSVQGGDASIDLESTAKVHVLNSQFFGLARRDPQAKFNDQGGNTWRSQ